MTPDWPQPRGRKAGSRPLAEAGACSAAWEVPVQPKSLRCAGLQPEPARRGPGLQEGDSLPGPWRREEGPSLSPPPALAKPLGTSGALWQSKALCKALVSTATPPTKDIDSPRLDPLLEPRPSTAAPPGACSLVGPCSPSPPPAAPCRASCPSSPSAPGHCTPGALPAPFPRELPPAGRAMKLQAVMENLQRQQRARLQQELEARQQQEQPPRPRSTPPPPVQPPAPVPGHNAALAAGASPLARSRSQDPALAEESTEPESARMQRAQMAALAAMRAAAAGLSHSSSPGASDESQAEEEEEDEEERGEEDEDGDGGYQQDMGSEDDDDL